MPTKISSIVEEYLETIFRLQERSGVARTSALIKALNVSPGTVTNTVERLERGCFIIHEPYRGVKLTEKGQRIALKIVRKHRLLERLLTDILNVAWERVHDAACQLEHNLSDEIVKKIEKVLGHPKTCPHGNPIPTKCGEIIEESSRLLTELNPEEKGIIVKITYEDYELLRYLNTLGLKPEVPVEVVVKEPSSDLITLRVNENECTLSREVAALIKVRGIEDRNSKFGGLQAWNCH